MVIGIILIVLVIAFIVWRALSIASNCVTPI